MFSKSLNWDEQIIVEMLIEKVTKNVDMMDTASFGSVEDFEISEDEINDDDCELSNISGDELDLNLEGNISEKNLFALTYFFTIVDRSYLFSR